MPDARLDTMRRAGVFLGAGVLRLVGPGVVVGVFIDYHCVADRVEVTC